MIGLLAVWAILSAALVPLIQRDLRRAVARREFRDRFRALTILYADFSRQIGDQLVPSMRAVAKAVGEMDPIIRRFIEALKAGKP